MIPEFAVLGHPNEGKSSVVSTLTEDDRIKISRTPGETKVSRQYTVTIDGEKLIRFVDTPGFQVPRQTLDWFKSYEGDSGNIVQAFIDRHKKDPFFSDECELFGPLTRGAGIIYVVDGSRPVRPDDLAEMEILRLTGRPRMAVINSKNQDRDYTADWRMEFRKHFNSIRVFNSNTANFMERILMLESLKSIDQEWEQRLDKVVRAFRQDWKRRQQTAGSIIMKTIESILSFSMEEKIKPGVDIPKKEKELTLQYQERVKLMEKQMFKKIRQLFKHNVFDYQLPDYSVLNYDLFSRQTWELLGLNREQLAAAGAVIGGTVGAVIDTAAAGITFGLFTAIGGVIGAGSAVLGSRKLKTKKKAGFRLGSDNIRVGPSKNLQFLYILIDRALIYYTHMINRPHGKRDERKRIKDDDHPVQESKKGPVSDFSKSQRAVCARYFNSVVRRSVLKGRQSGEAFAALLESVLENLSNSGHGPY